MQLWLYTSSSGTFTWDITAHKAERIIFNLAVGHKYFSVFKLRCFFLLRWSSFGLLSCKGSHTWTWTLWMLNLDQARGVGGCRSPGMAVATVKPIRNSVLQTVQLFSRLPVNSSIEPLSASGQGFCLYSWQGHWRVFRTKICRDLDRSWSEGAVGSQGCMPGSKEMEGI